MGPTRFTYYKQDGFEVWGKEYRDSAGAVTWRLRVFSDQDRRIESYEDVTVEPPVGTRTGESKAMRDAIAAWLVPANPPGKEVQTTNDAADVEARITEARITEARITEAQTPEAQTPDAPGTSESPTSLTQEERNSLSPRARAYVQYLEQKVSRSKR